MERTGWTITAASWLCMETQWSEHSGEAVLRDRPGWSWQPESCVASLLHAHASRDHRWERADRQPVDHTYATSISGGPWSGLLWQTLPFDPALLQGFASLRYGKPSKNLKSIACQAVPRSLPGSPRSGCQMTMLT